MLHRHESTEQQIIHPLLGDIDDILSEERTADTAIAELIALGVDDPAFDGKLADLHAAVLAHAAHEEEQEFPALRDTVPAEQLVALASQVRANQTEIG
jgi:hypothetical protein